MLLIVLPLYKELPMVLIVLLWRQVLPKLLVHLIVLLTKEEAHGEVDIVEGTCHRRLVMRIGTRSTNTHEATMRLLQSVQSL